MADSTKAIPTRETHWGRWAIIYEVRVPTTFTRRGKDGSTETVSVSPAIVKAVLLHLAEWDAPGSRVYQGVRRISHDTGIPEASVEKALRVLREAGLLKRTPRGWHETSLSVLDWDKLEKLRVPFRSTFAPKDEPPSTDEREVLDDLDPAVRLSPEPVEPSADLMTQVRALPRIGEKLTSKDAQWFAANLVTDLGEEGAMGALTLLADNHVALTRAAVADKSTTGYLKACAIRAFRNEVIDQAREVADHIRTGEVNCSHPEGSEGYARAIHTALLGSSFVQEFEIHEVTRGESGWWVPLSPRAEVSNG